MEWIKTFREKQQTSKQNNITMQAHDAICLEDFDGKIYIAHNNVPLVPVEDNWTPKDIIKKLEETRTGYINYKMKQLNQPKVAAIL